MIDILHRYNVKVGYAAATETTSERREWTFVAEELCEDDAIWTALSAFRHDEVRTWQGWPRDVLFIAVEREADA